jgi:hypothetical protein
MLATSAVENAVIFLDDNPNWRVDLQNDMEYPSTPAPLGSGTFHWKLVDGDGDLADDPSDAVLLQGIGRVGGATYVQQVQLLPMGAGLGCLEASLCVGTHADFVGATITGNQFICSNNSMYAASTDIDVPAKAVYSVSGGNYNAGTEVGIAARQMPDPTSVFDFYVSNGTFIDYDSLDSDTGGARQMNRRVLSPSTNPFGTGATNPSGIYVIDCGGARFRAQFCRIVGTLVLLNPGWDSRFFNSNFLEPAIDNYPTLLVQGSFRIDMSADPLDEYWAGTNFNPPGTPYEGDEDTDQVDTYPCMAKGLVYISGDVASNTSDNQTIDGVLIIGNYFDCGAPFDFQYRSTFLDNPPPGFAGGNRMQISPGSWQHVASP